MGYKRNTKKVRDETQQWLHWFNQHAELVAASGLPSFVWSVEENWAYFLDHSCVEDYGTDKIFRVEELSTRQKVSLLRLIWSLGSTFTITERRLGVYLLEAVENLLDECE